MPEEALDLATRKPRNEDTVQRLSPGGATNARAAGPTADPLPEEDQASTTGIRSVDQAQLRIVWEGVQSHMPLTAAQERTARILREHPEYYDLWARLGNLSKQERERDGTDPIMHVTLHTIVENQVAAGDPPEVRRAIGAMVRRGMGRHEAVHGVARFLAEEMYSVLFEHKAFDHAAYVAKVRRLLHS